MKGGFYVLLGGRNGLFTPYNIDDKAESFVFILHLILRQGETFHAPAVHTTYTGMLTVDEEVGVFRLRHIRKCGLQRGGLSADLPEAGFWRT